MADYINSNILSQSYVHVEPKWLDGLSPAEKTEKIQEIKTIIEEYAVKRLKFFLYDDVQVKIEFEEGSIKAKITTYGSICVLLNSLNPIGNAIEKYPQYRDGIKLIVSDVVKAGDMVNSEVVFQTKSKGKREIISIEARKGIAGSLDKINRKINEITQKTKHNNENNPSAILENMFDLHKFVVDLMVNLKGKDDKKAIANALIDGVSDINLRKGRFVIGNEIDSQVYESLLRERKNITDFLTEEVKED